jgi:hypothetical protein
VTESLTYDTFYVHTFSGLRTLFAHSTYGHLVSPLAPLLLAVRRQRAHATGKSLVPSPQAPGTPGGVGFGRGFHHRGAWSGTHTKTSWCAPLFTRSLHLNAFETSRLDRSAEQVISLTKPLTTSRQGVDSVCSHESCERECGEMRRGREARGNDESIAVARANARRPRLS